MPDIGPFFFHWVEDEDVEFDEDCEVCDEQIIRFSLEHNEGDCAKLTIDVRNPRIGPLAPSRPIWAWFSWQDDSSDAVVPLFFGRLSGVPTNILAEVITYTLVARPSDYNDLLEDLAESKRVLPFYDPIFVREELAEDPTVVWEGYSEIWHIDRITHEVTSSDHLVGDSVVVFADADAIHETVQLTLDRRPLQAVQVKGSIPWSQRASGVLDFGTRTFLTYNGESIVGNWPKTGDALAGGYYVVHATAIDDLGTGTAEPLSWSVSWQNTAEKHRDGDLMSYNESASGFPSGVNPVTGGTTISDITATVIGDPKTGTPASFSRNRSAMLVRRQQISTQLVLGIDADRDLKDNVSLLLTSDLQPVLDDPAEAEPFETIELSTNDIADDCEDDPAIGNAGRAEYATTDRGLQSIQYMIARARAKLILGSRVVSVTWDCPFAKAVNLSCRMNAQIFDDRIPGEAAFGKIVSYGLRGDGTTGEFRGFVKIGCAIGLGNAITTSAGTPDYVEEGALEPGIQTYTGQVNALPTGDVGWSPPVLVAGGGAMPLTGLTKNDLVIREEIITELEEQESAMGNVLRGLPPGPILNGPGLFQLFRLFHEEIVRLAMQALAETEMYYEIELVDLTSRGAESEWEVATVPLVIPRQIDLTADASA